ncbi:hypothetical protein CTA1_1695 [Colletotrichum tanaceti]|uniref:Uncharacterized protein n=1 Tax=Colletotrichum tanaceti TaxID=1306861 RepID=A0A4U6XSM4_9PEZI|nr:hypothetical protein CTA1_1695 [Colletotrichum tanaceti]
MSRSPPSSPGMVSTVPTDTRRRVRQDKYDNDDSQGLRGAEGDNGTLAFPSPLWGSRVLVYRVERVNSPAPSRPRP